jgi:hypothetical protein
MGDVLTQKCRHGVLINEGFPFDDVPQHHTTPDTTVWIDLCRPSKSSTSGPPETTHRPHNPHIPMENRVPPVSQGEARRAGGRPTAIQQPGMPGGQVVLAVHPTDRPGRFDQHRGQPFVAVPFPGRGLFAGGLMHRRRQTIPAGGPIWQSGPYSSPTSPTKSRSRLPR